MTKPISFNQAIRSWMDVFMHHSMRGWGLFAKSVGLSMTQFGILLQLQHKGACPMSEVSERFEITPAAASQLVDKLVQGGFIKRDEDPHDRRAKVLEITGKGRDLLQQGIEERYRWMEGLVDKLTAEQKAKISESLVLLTEAARGMEQ
jgi:DNA-binding MarR family transcriptional regulator